MRDSGFSVVVAILYIILSVILTYPMALHMSDRVPGIYDVWNHLWNLWWVRTSILEMHQSPYYTPYIFHPSGADLALHEMALVDGLMALPFKNIIFAYNTLCLLSFFLSGLGMYFLAFYVIGDRKAAFVSGLIYAFAPYHFFEVNVGHLHTLTIQWIPFYVLYLLKTVREKSWRNPLYCAFFLLLVSLSTWQYALYAILFTLLYLFHIHINDKKGLADDWQRIKILALCYLALTGLLVVNVFFSMVLYDVIKSKSFLTLVYYSSDALGIFLPNPAHSIYGKHAQNILRNTAGYSTYQAAVSIGYTTILLTAYYITKKQSVVGWIKGKVTSVEYTPRVKRVIVFISTIIIAFLYITFHLDVTAWGVWLLTFFSIIVAYHMIRERKIGFWLLSALFFWILSLGPMLRFMGRMYYPLPYLFLMAIPLIRAPYRAVVFFNLAVALLAGMGLSELNKRFNRSSLLTLLASSLLLFECLSIPIFLSDTSVPEFYHTLREEQGDFAVLEVQIAPMELFYDKGNVCIDNYMPQYTYYQTIHGKRIVGGMVSSKYSDLMDFLDNTPVLHQLRNPGSQDILMQNVSRIANSVLSYYNIRYVIVHNNTLHILDDVQENASIMIQHTLNGFFPDNEVVYNDSTMYAIRVNDEEIPMFMRLGRGWYMPSNGSRWMKESAELIIESTIETETEICFKARGAVKAPLEANGIIFNLDESFRNNTLRIRLKPGENKITFKSPRGCLKEPCITFNFKNIWPSPCKTEQEYY